MRLMALSYNSTTAARCLIRTIARLLMLEFRPGPETPIRGSLTLEGDGDSPD
jgi:hypothetical protein